jgi:hypothetical protein
MAAELTTVPMYANFLTEIASYGYIVIANGKTSGLGMSKVS